LAPEHEDKYSDRPLVGGSTNTPIHPPRRRDNDRTERQLLEGARKGDTSALLGLYADERVHASVKLRRSVVLHLARQTRGPQNSSSPVSPCPTEGDPAAISALTDAATTDPDRKVRLYAVTGLARMQDASATSGLLAGLSSDDYATRYWAIRGVARLKARDALPGLIRLLGQRRHRYAAAAALVEIRDERALEPLRKAARRGAPWTRLRLRRRAAALAGSLGTSSN
jgi:HEAT repeat protein